MSSNKELDHAGPCPFAFTVYGVDGEELPQIEEHPVAFGYGMLLAQRAIRDGLKAKVEDVVANGTNEDVKAAGQE